jgi:hypothetical protein
VWLKVFAALLVILGAGTLVCLVAWCVAAYRDREVERQETPEPHPLAGRCVHGVGMLDDCPDCRLAHGAEGAFVGPTVVAGDDLDWQLFEARRRRDWDTYRIEHRLPGERAS